MSSVAVPVHRRRRTARMEARIVRIAPELGWIDREEWKTARRRESGNGETGKRRIEESRSR